MRVLVCGGRTYYDRVKVFSVLNDLLKQHGSLTVIEGGTNGADALAREWCMRARRSKELRGYLELIEVPADWKAHGKAAGPMRNEAMIEHHKPDLVVAFPGGKGTADCVARARKAGIEVMEVEG
jgi:predicted Rossmann-fold nucleotide-binding protein